MKPWPLLFCWSLLLAPAQAEQITVFTPYPARVLIRPYGTGPYHEAAPRTPATLSVDHPGLYDLRVVAQLSWFTQARGEQPKVASGTTVTIPMAVEWDIKRVALAAMAAVGTGAWAAGRASRRPRLPHPAVASPAAAGPAPAVLKPGDAVGPYCIVLPIARGGMGTVYEVEDSFGDRYAMKVPDNRLLEDVEFATRFRREVEIGKQLRHPHIIRIFDYNLGESGPRPYIVLEMVRGPSLKDLMALERPMAIERAVHLLLEVLDALEYGHQHGVIHRDVKPGNVLVTPGGQCKLADYGIARVQSAQTVTQHAIGTPMYMAPEQLHSKSTGPQVDVYAAATMLFEMITGRLPFENEDQYVLMMQKMALDPPNPSDFNPQVSRALDHVLLRGLARDPQLRYPSARAFREDLAGVL